jgi:hypothetical protein
MGFVGYRFTKETMKASEETVDGEEEEDAQEY